MSAKFAGVSIIRCTDADNGYISNNGSLGFFRRFSSGTVGCRFVLVSTRITPLKCKVQLGPRQVTLYLHNNEDGGLEGLLEQEISRFQFALFSSPPSASATLVRRPPSVCFSSRRVWCLTHERGADLAVSQLARTISTHDLPPRRDEDATKASPAAPWIGRARSAQPSLPNTRSRRASET